MKRIRIISVFMLALLLALSLGSSALAEGKVTYQGGAEAFILEPGSAYSPTDLFEGFKGVMPGDVLSEQITVKNEASRGVKVRLYMRSLGAQEGTEAFLSQMALKVTQAEETLLFEASSDQTAQLTDWTYLGTLYSGGETTLNVQLTVPLELSNDFQKAIGYIDWQFMVEELPIEPTDPAPETGDSSRVLLWAVLMLIALAVLIVLSVQLFRRRGARER